MNLACFAVRWSVTLLIGGFIWPACIDADVLASDAADLFTTTSGSEPHSWYQLKPGEFPPIGTENRVAGELLEVDFIHRTGQFRVNGTGDLLDFTLTPFAVISYLNAEADLRDLPLGNRYFFFLYQDQKGAFTRVAAIRDKYSMLAGEGVSYRLDVIKTDADRLVVTRQKLSANTADADQIELPVSDKTRVWKGERQVKLHDLVVGDALLINYGTGPRDDARFCTDIWVGTETHRLVTEQQRKKHHAFLKFRGIPAWIDYVKGKKMAVTLFGDPAGMRAFLSEEAIDPAKWAVEGRRVRTVVANEELRTYNPPVDGQGSKVLEFESVPVANFGCAGICWVLEPNLLLEGFRKGRVVRIFKEGWPLQDMPFGESLYSEVFGVRTGYEANQYPFRTDFANEALPWYQLKPGEFPPEMSEHRIGGELLKIDASHRSGQFRADYTGELINFTLPPFGSVMYLNAEVNLQDAPLGMRYLFFLHPDAKGAFTVASVIMDAFTELAGSQLTYRIEEIKAEQGKLIAARQMAPVKDEKEQLVRPPDYGRLELAFDDTTRIQKNGSLEKPGALLIGDELLVNSTGRTSKDRGRCLEVWVGDDMKQATETQRAKMTTFLREHGLPAWIESVEGKKLTIHFFSGDRKEFASVLDGDPNGKSVFVMLADDALSAEGANPVKMAYGGHLPEGNSGGTYGSSGVRWIIEPEVLPEGFSKGRVIRVFKEGWPIREPAGK
ncbi:MAG: hypothetical protein JWL59_5107 [Chthoniobacteraceae bacterium]|nr:hypothetical protein [Chthoniobacteraceae bacterium]